VVAEVEQNPRDGVWLLVRVRAGGAVTNGALGHVARAFALSDHGTVSFRESESPDLLLYVHADDVLALLP